MGPHSSWAHPVRTLGGVYLMSRIQTRIRPLSARLGADLRAHRPEVIGDLLTEFGRELQGVAFLIVRNHADAEEVVMDALLTAWRHAGELRDDNALRTWLLRIVTRHALSRRRRRHHSTVALELAAPLHASRADQPSADRLAIAEALGELPPKMRAAVALHHYAGLTVPQVAEAMGVSQNTIKGSLRQGMARLRLAFGAPGSDAGQSWSRSDA